MGSYVATGKRYRNTRRIRYRCRYGESIRIVGEPFLQDVFVSYSHGADQNEVDETDPKAAQKARDNRVKVIAECDALLILATADRRALEADLVTIAKADRQSARPLNNRFLPCAVVDNILLAVTRSA